MAIDTSRSPAAAGLPTPPVTSQPTGSVEPLKHRQPTAVSNDNPALGSLSHTGKTEELVLTSKPSGGRLGAMAPDVEKRLSDGVMIADVALVLFQVAQQQRKLASEDRQSAMDASIKNMENSVLKLKEAAQKNYDAALNANIGALVGAGITLAGTAGGALKFGGKAETVTLVSATTTLSQSLGQVASVGGKMQGDKDTLEAENKRADAKADDALAARRDKQYGEANDFRDVAKQTLSAVLDLVRAKVQSELEAEKSVARNL